MPPEGREENYFESIALFCCPKIRLVSFIVIVTLVELVLFVVSCSINGGISNWAFLAPKQKSLDQLGA